MSSQQYVAPRNETEGALVEIWSSVLGVAQVGVFQEFLDLGGDSMSVTLCINRISDVLKADVPVDCFFVEPTHIAAIAAFIDMTLQKQTV